MIEGLELVLITIPFKEHSGQSNVNRTSKRVDVTLLKMSNETFRSRDAITY